MIPFTCPKCQARLEITDRQAGGRTACPECGARCRVPGPDGRRPRSRWPVLLLALGLPLVAVLAVVLLVFVFKETPPTVEASRLMAAHMLTPAQAELDYKGKVVRVVGVIHDVVAGDRPAVTLKATPASANDFIVCGFEAGTDLGRVRVGQAVSIEGRCFRYFKTDPGLLMIENCALVKVVD